MDNKIKAARESKQFHGYHLLMNVQVRPDCEVCQEQIQETMKVWSIPLAQKGFIPIDLATNPVLWNLEIHEADLNLIKYLTGLLPAKRQLRYRIATEMITQCIRSGNANFAFAYVIIALRAIRN